MVLCEQCGSIRIVRVEPNTIDTALALFTSKRPFLCRRCGWRARRDWSDDALRELEDYGVGGAVADPSLIVLDLVQPERRKGKNKRRAKKQQRSAFEPAFDLDSLDTAPSIGSGGLPAIPKSPSTSRRRQKRRGTPRRREILAAIVFTTTVFTTAGFVAFAAGCLTAVSSKF